MLRRIHSRNGIRFTLFVALAAIAAGTAATVFAAKPDDKPKKEPPGQAKKAEQNQGNANPAQPANPSPGNPQAGNTGPSTGNPQAGNVSATLAGTFTAFGPRDYIRSTKKPVSVTDNFSVLNPDISYALLVYNGGNNNQFQSKTSNAVIELNGVEVARPSEFSRKPSYIQKPINLSNDNELAVEIRGKPGSGITVEIVGIDNDPPSIVATLSPLPNAAGWNRTDVTVSFECSDAASGIASCPDPVMVTDEGAGQVVEGTAVDRVGLSSVARVTVNLDKTPPDLAVSSEEELEDPALEVLYVENFELVWNDDGSGASRDGAFYRPIAPSGYSVIGYYGQGNHNDPDGTVAVVKELEPGALAAPVGYEPIWIDSGSGADRDGAFWRPIPPEGYTCLGQVVTGYDFGTGYDPPNVNEIQCVRSDLVAPATTYMSIWNDDGSGADRDVGTWITAPSNGDGIHLGLMTARSYGENEGYAPPTSGLSVLDHTKVRGASFPLNGQALEVLYVEEFEPVWNDDGSGASRDGAFYRPIAPSGYAVIGYYGQGNHNDPDGTVAVVKELEPGALAAPTGYQRVWTDSGSGSDRDGAFWRPIPPEGYTCLGQVVTGYDFGTGYDPPSTDAIRCVRTELTAPARIDRAIWDDRGSGADDDLTVWHLVPGNCGAAYPGTGNFGGIYLGTFTSVRGGDYPSPRLLPWQQPMYTLRESAVTADSWVMAPVASLSGVASDALSGVAAVTCNGAPAPLDDSTFECNVSLTGHTQVTIVATDMADNEAVRDQGFTSGLEALDVEYATSFDLVWDDRGSGADYDGAFYRPDLVSGSGFSAVGHYGQGDYETPLGLLLTARERTTGALAPPAGYERIWADVGSEADDDGAFWWPLPRHGYRCLGVVATGYCKGCGYSPPDLDQVRCVRSELVAPGYIGSRIWDDSRSLADRDFGSWQIGPSGGNGLFTGTFAGQSYRSDEGYAKPSYPVYVLDVRGVASPPPLSEEEVSALIATQAPVIRLHNDPDEHEQYLPDDPEQVLDAAKLEYALVRNEGSCDEDCTTGAEQYYEYHSEMQTSAATLMDDVAYIEDEIKPLPPYNDHSDFRIWLRIPEAWQLGSLDRAKPVVHVRPRGPLTEIQFWYFYPFNGPGRLRICLAHCENEVFNESGRHWGDWEMVSLLVDNSSQSLVGAGLSHHGNVEWVQYDHLEKHTDGVRPLVYAALNSHAHYRHAGRHYYEVVAHLGEVIATTYDLTGNGQLIMVGAYYLAPDEQSLASHWLGFPYRWGQYIENCDEVYFLSTNYFDYEEVNPGPSGPPRKPEW